MATEEATWRLCERTKMIEYERRGCAVIQTGRGSDFVAVCPDRKATFVEVKKGCGSLTEFQKKTMQEVRKKGFDYEVERCSCSRKPR
jgi:hypothetical protein